MVSFPKYFTVCITYQPPLVFKYHIRPIIGVCYCRTYSVHLVTCDWRSCVWIRWPNLPAASQNLFREMDSLKSLMWNPFVSTQKTYTRTDFATDGIQANSLNVLEVCCDR